MVNIMLTLSPLFEHAQLMDPFDSNLSAFHFPILNTGNNITYQLAAVLRKRTKVCEIFHVILYSQEVFNSMY